LPGAIAYSLCCPPLWTKLTPEQKTAYEEEVEKEGEEKLNENPPV